MYAQTELEATGRSVLQSDLDLNRRIEFLAHVHGRQRIRDRPERKSHRESTRQRLSRHPSVPDVPYTHAPIGARMHTSHEPDVERERVGGPEVSYVQAEGAEGRAYAYCGSQRTGTGHKCCRLPVERTPIAVKPQGPGPRRKGKDDHGGRAGELVKPEGPAVRVPPRHRPEGSDSSGVPEDAPRSIGEGSICTSHRDSAGRQISLFEGCAGVRSPEQKRQ